MEIIMKKGKRQRVMVKIQDHGSRGEAFLLKNSAVITKNQLENSFPTAGFTQFKLSKYPKADRGSEVFTSLPELVHALF